MTFWLPPVLPPASPPDAISTSSLAARPAARNFMARPSGGPAGASPAARAVDRGRVRAKTPIIPRRRPRSSPYRGRLPQRYVGGGRRVCLADGGIEAGPDPPPPGASANGSQTRRAQVRPRHRPILAGQARGLQNRGESDGS